MTLILDTETTGLPKNMQAPFQDSDNWPQMLSIAWRAYSDSGELLDRRNYIVAPRPGVVNSEGAMKVNGITPEMQAANGVGIRKVLTMLYAAMNNSSLVVAHNVAFDKNIILAEFYRAEWASPPAKWFCTKEDIGNLLNLPPTERQRQYRPNIQYKQPTLDELYQFLFGVPVPGRENTHGAEQDAAACAACYWELKRRGLI